MDRPLKPPDRIVANHRVAFAFLFAPALAAVAMLVLSRSDAFTFIVMIIVMALVTVMLAVPMFVLLRAMGWLQWPHALLAGTVCGVLGGMFVGGPFIYGAFGGAIGLLFWWLAVFRNPDYPAVSRKLPLLMVGVIPLGMLWFWYAGQVGSRYTVARLVEAPVVTEANWDSARVRIQLPDGSTVPARLGGFIPKRLEINTCFAVTSRRDPLLLKRRYVVEHHAGRYGCSY